MDPSPALLIHLDGLESSSRDRLVGLLSDHGLVAIQEDDLSNPTLWTAHFASAEDRAAAATGVGVSPEFSRMRLDFIDIADDDWARRTQADLPAVRIGRLIVAPPWDLPAPDPDTIVIVIEPSRGFGTGHHQSTRLCLALLQNRDLAGQTMLDVGTGSGVLAIAAAKLGAAYVAAIDVDPDAVENARENIAANGVTSVVEAHVEDFTTATRTAAAVVTANLTGTILARHAPELMRCVRPDGALIVSGFNIEEKNVVEDAFSPGFVLSESAEEEGWWAFVLTPSIRLA